MIEGGLSCNCAGFVEFRVLPADGKYIEAQPGVIYNLADASAKSREAIRPSESKAPRSRRFSFSAC